MPKTHPRIEILEFEVSVLRKTLDEIRRDPGDLPCLGCGDSSCVIRKPAGQHTNGGCRCSERELRRALQWYKRRSQFLEETVKQLTSERSTIDSGE